MNNDTINMQWTYATFDTVLDNYHVSVEDGHIKGGTSPLTS